MTKLFEDNSLDFSILVENTGNRDLTNLTIKDFCLFSKKIIFNPGVYDKNKAEINWSIGNLNVGESKVFTIRTRIGEVKSKYSQMLTNKVCVNGDNVSDCDRASFLWPASRYQYRSSLDFNSKSIGFVRSGYSPRFA